MKKTYLIFFLLLAVFVLKAGSVSAHQPRIILSQPGEITVVAPETSQAFYDDLKGKSRFYNIDSPKAFDLYVNLLVPATANGNGQYSAKISSVIDGKEEELANLDGSSFEWKGFYESFGRDYYFKGPEFSKQVSAGKYKIEVYSVDDKGEYVLVVGQKEIFDAKSIFNIYWQIPFLKLVFFKTSVLEFLFTPFGIALIALLGALLILIAVIYYIKGLLKVIKKHNDAKTLLLTSAGMRMKEDIVKLLQKPAYDVEVAFITTAAKPEEDLTYLQNDWSIMKDLGFNIEELDIEGKTEAQVMKELEMKDIIFVEGGNTFYLLKAMRACNFEKVIKKLLKDGKVYIGVSAGSIVAGKTIQTAEWGGDKNAVKLSDLKGLNIVPFDIFVHYSPEDAEKIKQQIPDPKKRANNLKIITDDQAILVQGSEVDLIGEGEAIVV